MFDSHNRAGIFTQQALEDSPGALTYQMSKHLGPWQFPSVDSVLPAVWGGLTTFWQPPTTLAFSWEFTGLPALVDIVAAAAEEELNASWLLQSQDSLWRSALPSSVFLSFPWFIPSHGGHC